MRWLTPMSCGGTCKYRNRFLFMRQTEIIQTEIIVAFCLAVGPGLVLGAEIVLAQASPAPVTPLQQAAPGNIARHQNCTPTQAVPQDGTITPKGTTTGQAEPLSEKLADTNGILCPPAGVDPEMHAPTPQGGTMPVIPPPGSPGGDPNVIPK